MFEIQGLYSYGWETVDTADTYAEALSKLDVYLWNEPAFQHRIK